MDKKGYNIINKIEENKTFKKSLSFSKAHSLNQELNGNKKQKSKNSKRKN